MNGQVIVLASRKGQILAANAFFGRRAPAAPGPRALVFDRPGTATDREIERDYEVTLDDRLVKKGGG